MLWMSVAILAVLLIAVVVVLQRRGPTGTVRKGDLPRTGGSTSRAQGRTPHPAAASAAWEVERLEADSLLQN